MSINELQQDVSWKSAENPSTTLEPSSSSLPLFPAANAHHKGPKSPTGKNLSPYLLPSLVPGGKNSPKSNGHVGAVRSLGLLHDLQEYITGVEALTLEQRQQLERLKGERRDAERVLYRLEVQSDRGGALNDFFRASEVADLPPKLRAVFEENRLMKEKLRKYKARTMLLEQQVSQRNSQILVLEGTIVSLKQQLALCSRTPDDVAREGELREVLSQREKLIATMEHQVQVLRQKLETDSRLQRQNLQGAKREQESLKRQIVQAAAGIEERDKELRAARLEVRRLQRHLAPGRKSLGKALYIVPDDEEEPSYQPSPTHLSPQQPIHQQQPSPPASRQPTPAEKIHLMLCVLSDQPSQANSPQGDQLPDFPPHESSFTESDGSDGALPLAEASFAPDSAPEPDPEPGPASPPGLTALQQMLLQQQQMHYDVQDQLAALEQMLAKGAAAGEGCLPEPSPRAVQLPGLPTVPEGSDASLSTSSQGPGQLTSESSTTTQEAEPAAPLATHLSAPKPVPYRNTAARAEARKARSQQPCNPATLPLATSLSSKPSTSSRLTQSPTPSAEPHPAATTSSAAGLAPALAGAGERQDNSSLTGQHGAMQGISNEAPGEQLGSGVEQSQGEEQGSGPTACLAAETGQAEEQGSTSISNTDKVFAGSLNLGLAT
ncbi:hypothetical protein V8C86DRAFT_2484466 [Haematococcus lacustris]